MKAMKNPFKRPGFDSLISADDLFQGSITIGANKTMVIDGQVEGDSITVVGNASADKTTVIIGGKVQAVTIEVPNVVITGVVHCGLLIVEGMLAIHADAELKATEIRYRSLHIETGAMVTGQMNHLDLISVGEHEPPSSSPYLHPHH